MLGKFQPPTGYLRLKRNAHLSVVCDRLLGTELIREIDVTAEPDPHPGWRANTNPGTPGALFREPPRHQS